MIMDSNGNILFGMMLGKETVMPNLNNLFCFYAFRYSLRESPID